MPGAREEDGNREPAFAELAGMLGTRFTRNPVIREQHGRGEAFPETHPPDAVAFPASTEETAAVLRVCHRYGVPVVAYGTGTSLEGHVAAVRGGLCLDLSRLDRILEVVAPDMNARVEAGVTRKQLNHHLRDTGLFFPVDPGADASLGGMAATRASGTNAVRYGTMRDAVLALTVVLADGRVIRTGSAARKSAAGYDLTALFLGSEGTLGVITELRLRLWPIPEATAAAVCAFPSLDAAVATVIGTIQAAVPVARIEFLDALQMRACIAHAKLAEMEPRPTLFYEFHGSRQAVREQAELAGAIAREHGGTAFRWATLPEERSRLWQARHDAYFAALALRPGAVALVTDVCVPISRLAEVIAETRREIAESGIPAPILGHVGDGNFHVVFLIDPDSREERATVERLNAAMVARALAAGGTCTGEHGIGLGKKASLAREAGPALEVMRAVKRALDPAGILNPGKIFDLEEDR